MRMRDPSEKIHSQIRRPSFSDSLLTVDSKRVLTGPQKHYSGPKRALPRTRRVSDSKMLPTSGQDSFCWSNNFIRRRRRERGAGAQHMLCRGRSVSRLSPSLSLQVFARHHSDNMQWGRKGATSAPKSAEGALRGCRTAPSPTTSTIRRYCAHHDQRYISHPDEEGERQFRLAPFGHSWKKASARGSVGAQLTIQSWPPTHFLAKESTGRRISAQRQLPRGGARYSALQRLHTTTVQFGKKSSLHSRWTLPTKYSRKFRESPKKSGTRPQPLPELGQHQGDPTPLQKIPGEIRPHRIIPGRI